MKKTVTPGCLFSPSVLQMVSCFSVLLMLAACGGGGDGDSSLVSSANASATEFDRRISAGTSADVAEPVFSGTTSGESAIAESVVVSEAAPVSVPPSVVPPVSPVIPPPSMPNTTSSLTCATGAITCVEIRSTSTQLQPGVPITFGQPFKAGDWKHKETGLIAVDSHSNVVPLQFDEISSHRDGSARFAVLSAQLSQLQAGERRVIHLFAGANNAATAMLPVIPSWDLKLEAKVYGSQFMRISFGNRNGQTAGTPFLQGESITLQLSGPAVEKYSIVVNAEQAGGGHQTLSKIAEAFMQAINRQSSVYTAEKIGAGGGYENVWIKTRDPGQGAFKAEFTYSGQAKINQVNESSYQAPEIWTATAQDLLKQAVATSNANKPDAGRRLRGAVATELGLSTPFRNASTAAAHPHLVARFDTRLYEGGTRIRTDVILENNWTFKPDPRNITYEFTIKRGSEVLYHQPAFTHYHHARWHKVVWTGTEPSVQLRHYMPYFMASRAVWNYDRSLAVPEKILEAEEANLSNKRAEQAALGPMGNVFLQPLFPATGGRPEIGPLPRWTALYLVTQDPRAYASMMANADAAAAVPVHYRDESTEQPVNAISHPTLSVYQAGPSTLDPTIWSPDSAHQGSYAYVPYLVTGDRFYLDEAMFWATWNVFMNPADYRSLGKALINRQQIRSQAWALRSIAEAHRMLADKHAMKPYFSQLLENNLAWYHDYYIKGSERAPMGTIQHDATSTAPWQNDFMNIVVALLAENDEPHARQLHAWFSRFSVGRFLADNEGFCAARAPGYYITNAYSAGNYITNWRELFAKNYPADVSKPCGTLTVTDGYPHLAGGYASYARAMLGAAANAGIANAATAYIKWKQMTPLMDQSFASDPTWAIVPR